MRIRKNKYGFRKVILVDAGRHGPGIAVSWGHFLFLAVSAAAEVVGWTLVAVLAACGAGASAFWTGAALAVHLLGVLAPVLLCDWGEARHYRRGGRFRNATGSIFPVDAAGKTLPYRP